MNRLKEPSTWAGVGLIFTALAQIIASKGTDQQAWAQAAAGVAAVALREGGK